MDETETIPSAAQDAPSPSPSAPEPAQQAEPQAPATQGDTASPPDASAGQEPKDDRTSLLEVVKSVVEKPAEPKTPQQGEGEAKEAAPEASSPDKAQAPPPDAALEADPTEAELKGMVPRTKARVEKLLSQRNEARREVEAVKPDAEAWRHFNGYLQRNKLAVDDVNQLMKIGAALRHEDWQAFLDGVRPYVEVAQQALGQSLPPDLQAAVDSGQIALEQARELSTTRLTNARLQSQAQATQAAQTQAAQSQQQAQTDASVMQAVVGWETSVRASDPDYAQLAPMVDKLCRAIMHDEGRPRTPEAGVALVQRAYDEARRMAGTFRPSPPSTRPTPSGARSVNGARPEPTNTLDAMRAGLDAYWRARA